MMNSRTKAMDELKRLYREFVDTVYIEDVNIGLVISSYNMFCGYANAMVMTVRSRRTRTVIYRHIGMATKLYNDYLFECKNYYVDLGIIID